MSSAREYARRNPNSHVGYIDCLNQIRSDYRNGETIDFSDWHEAETLTQLSEEDLNILLDMYRDYCGSRQEKTINIMKRCGIQSGAKPQEAPRFDEEAERYLNGEQNGIEASKNCGLKYTTFQNRIESLKKQLAEDTLQTGRDLTDDIINKWRRRELTKIQAAKALGIRVQTFNKILKAGGIEQEKEPALFDKYYSLWKEKKITKEEAVEKCGIGKTYFEQLTRERRKKGL